MMHLADAIDGFGDSKHSRGTWKKAKSQKREGIEPSLLQKSDSGGTKMRIIVDMIS
jgi:hypothetical protein